jgi:hypothetical protein
MTSPSGFAFQPFGSSNVTPASLWVKVFSWVDMVAVPAGIADTGAKSTDIAVSARHKLIVSFFKVLSSSVKKLFETR